MPITTTTINGTDSVSASRITINDNFNTIIDALNDVLSIIDIATGKINNYGYGSNNDTETNNLVVRGSSGISVTTGPINVQSGNVIIGGVGNGLLQVGSGTNAIYFEKVTKQGYVSVATNYPTVNLSGIADAEGAGPIGCVTLPRMTLEMIKDIKYPAIGSVVNVINAGGTGCYPVVCTESGNTGTWQPLTLGTAI